MTPVGDVVLGILFLAPGFLALKVVQLVGPHRPRSDWEWAAWSVIVSLPITYFASVLRRTQPIEEWWGSTPASLDGPEITLRVILAILAGLVGVFVWAYIRQSTWRIAVRIRAYVQDSAWDQTLHDVDKYKRPTELVLTDGRRYMGTIRYAGREDHKAEPWIYLIYPEVYDKELRQFRDAKATHGILVHRDQIARIRVLPNRDEGEANDHPSELAAEVRARAINASVTAGVTGAICAITALAVFGGLVLAEALALGGAFFVLGASLGYVLHRIGKPRP